MGMRPKKPRFVDGIQLVDNLYPDPRKRAGYYSYVRPDNGKRKTFSRDTVQEANAFALELTEVIGKGFTPTRSIPPRDQLIYHIPIYIRYQEKINPALKGKEGWKNQGYAFHQFAKLSEFERLGQINMDSIRSWWDEQGYNQQKLRMASFRRLFNWLMGQGLVPKLKFNPFTTSDDLPRLLLKHKPKKSRKALTLDHYTKISTRAVEMGYECLSIAMGISLYTTARQADVCGLKWGRNLVDGNLRMIVSKSEAQKGHARAARFEWDLSKHPELKALIDRARELSLVNKRCPFIISHTPRRRVWNEEKEHLHQVTGERLCRMFREVMEACGIEGTSFHEVRGLASTLYKKAGYTTEQIRGLMAHEHISTTLGYQDAGALPYETITMKLEQ